MASRATQLVNAMSPDIDKLVADNPYNRAAKTPAGIYSNKEDITTFGVDATFVGSTEVPDKVVCTVVKADFENF